MFMSMEAAEVDTMDQTTEAIKLMSTGIAKNGVTSFLPTTMTMSSKDIYGALDVVRECMGQSIKRGQSIRGSHGRTIYQ